MPQGNYYRYTGSEAWTALMFNLLRIRTICEFGFGIMPGRFNSPQKMLEVLSYPITIFPTPIYTHLDFPP